MQRILIDLNSVAHAGHQGTVLKSGDMETQAIFATLKFARATRLKYRDATLLGLWDGLSFRKALDPNYKAQRSGDVTSEEDTPAKKKADAKKRISRASYTAQAPFIRKSLHMLAFPQLVAMNLEADDLAAVLTRKWVAADDHVHLITGDQDWLQLVGPQCTWEDHRLEERKVNHLTFSTYTGYPTPRAFLQSKALQGDTSDNLPGVGGIGEKGAADLLAVWGDVLAFFSDIDPAETYLLKTGKPLPKKFKEFHWRREGRDKFFHNIAMMNLLGDLPAPEGMKLQKGELNPDAFKALCHELGFASIYRPNAFENWIQPFKKEI